MVDGKLLIEKNYQSLNGDKIRILFDGKQMELSWDGGKVSMKKDEALCAMEYLGERIIEPAFKPFTLNKFTEEDYSSFSEMAVSAIRDYEEEFES